MTDIDKKLKEIVLEAEKSQLASLTYRKEEIMDLISAVNKVTNQKTQSVSDQVKNDLQLKLEKLQNELTTIDDELFELEKKYGEYKKPPTIVPQKKAEVIDDKKEKDSPKSEGEVVNAEEPESSSSPVVVEEVQETQEEVVVIESEELTIETLKQKIKDYETKIEELT